MFEDEPDATPELPRRNGSSRVWYDSTGFDTKWDDAEAMKSYKRRVTNLYAAGGMTFGAGAISLGLGALTKNDERPGLRVGFFLAGGALMVTGLVLAIVGSSLEPPTPKNTRSPNAVSTRPIVPQHRAWSAGLGPGFVTLQGSF